MKFNPIKKQWKEWTLLEKLTVIGILSGILFSVYNLVSPPTDITEIAPIHTGSGDINIGITLEQYETGLRKREQEVTRRLEKAHDKDKQLLEREKKEIQSRLHDLKRSYEEHIADLRKRITELESLRGKVADDLLDKARKALADGNTEKADKLFQRIEKQSQEAIDVAAEAAFQRGKIAYNEIRYQQAYEHFQRAYRLVPDKGLYLNQVGWMAWTLGRYEKAIEYYELALASDLKTYGENHPSVARDRNNLGVAWHDLGQYEKAIEYYELALANNLKTYGEDHPIVARDHNNLGVAWESLGQYEKAVEYYELALNILLKTFDQDHPHVVTCRKSLHQAQEKLKTAHTNGIKNKPPNI